MKTSCSNQAQSLKAIKQIDKDTGKNSLVMRFLFGYVQLRTGIKGRNLFKNSEQRKESEKILSYQHGVY